MASIILEQIYTGMFKQKKADGRGLMRWREGDKYEGEWKDGLRHGKGEYFSKVKYFYLEICPNKILLFSRPGLNMRATTPTT